MEVYDEERRRIRAKMAELAEIKEKLKKAKDSATHSWLASRPLTNDLEKLKSTLAVAKNRASISNAVTSELERELEATNISIRSKMDKEIKAKKKIDEINEDLNKIHKELEIIKQSKEEERRARLKLKQTLRMRRQTLKTLQVTLQALEIESEGFSASVREALGYINNNSRFIDNSSVKLTLEDYSVLTERAKEETALAEWRVSLFLKQKLAAEVSRNMALSRLKELKRKKTKEKEVNEDENIIKEVNEEQVPVRVEAQVNRGVAFPESEARVTKKSNRYLQRKKRRSRNGKKLGKTKKPSILIQVRRFFVQSITRLFR